MERMGREEKRLTFHHYHSLFIFYFLSYLLTSAKNPNEYTARKGVKEYMVSETDGSSLSNSKTYREGRYV